MSKEAHKKEFRSPSPA